MRVASLDVAAASDPPYPIPLNQGARLLLARNTAEKPKNARVNRLELSALGGTLLASAVFDSFEWEHRAVLGRDMHVRTLAKGAMYPFGHRAQFVEISERIYDEDQTAGGAAVLRKVNVLTILDPVRHPPVDGPIRRGFPFGNVTITRTVYANLDNPRWENFPPGTAVPTYFWPTRGASGPSPPSGPPPNAVLFPVQCATGTGVVRLNVPMLFVADVGSLANPDLARLLQTRYDVNDVRIPPTNIDLVGAPSGAVRDADVHEVHALKIAGVTAGLNLADGYRPTLAGLDIAVRALRILLGGDPHAHVKFAPNYLSRGLSEDVFLEMEQGHQITVDFTNSADRSGGLVAPAFDTNAVSRTCGPINRFALPDPVTGCIDPQSLFPPNFNATLFGFPLRYLLDELKSPPAITTPSVGSSPPPGGPPAVQMAWPNVKLKTFRPFTALPSSLLDLKITVVPRKVGARYEVSSSTRCFISDFALELPLGNPVLRLNFSKVTYTQSTGAQSNGMQSTSLSPSLTVEGVTAEFLGALVLLKELEKVVASIVDPAPTFGPSNVEGAGTDPSSRGKLVEVQPTGIVVRYSVAVPEIASGVFVMRNMTFNTQIDVPFNDKPHISLGFATRAAPFALTVLMFGGGGYVELDLSRDGIQRFEAALEFGALIAVNFVVASAEVHALGGVRFVLDDGAVTVAGYLRIGGVVNILGLVSVSVEICIALAYVSTRKALVGRATLVVEIDLTLWSTTVELDSGEWVLAGDTDQLRDAVRAAGAKPPPPDTLLELWHDYRAAFTDLSHPPTWVARVIAPRYSANGDGQAPPS
jgi:hypothetical protein